MAALAGEGPLARDVGVVYELVRDEARAVQQTAGVCPSPLCSRPVSVPVVVCVPMPAEG